MYVLGELRRVDVGGGLVFWCEGFLFSVCVCGVCVGVFLSVCCHWCGLQAKCQVLLVMIAVSCLGMAVCHPSTTPWTK